MHRALLELTVDGVETSRDFHLRVMEHDDFRRGDISIQWLEQHLAELTQAPPPPGGMLAAAIAGALLAERDRSARGTPAAATTAVRAPAASANGAATSDGNDGWRRAARLEGLRTP